MAKKYHANFEVLWLSAILHDIVRIEDVEPHDELGAKKAKLILSEKGFDKKTIDLVCDTILTHSCKKFPPKTLEQKILATADAVAHFTAPFYLWAFKYFAKPFPETTAYALKKIENDYQNKIFFEDEKKLVEKQYLVLKNWFKT
jgi:HD superfamily phosphodiesterase